MPNQRRLKDYKGFKIIKAYDFYGGRSHVVYNAYHPKAGNLSSYPSLGRLKREINKIVRSGYKKIGKSGYKSHIRR